MSRIYFHTEDGSAAEVRGPERFHARVICNILLQAAIGPIFDTTGNPHWLRRYLPKDCYALPNTGKQFADSILLWLRASSDDLIVEGLPVSALALTLNTAYRMGGETVKFLARVDAQCEAHAYAEAHNRAWLAGIIERGRTLKILRANMGWENVIGLLRDANHGAVVMSYSVSNSFPDGDLVRDQDVWVPDGYSGEDDEDFEEWMEGWAALSREKRWHLGMTALRHRGGGLEMKPEGWEDYYFDLGITAFDLLPAIE